MIIVIAVFSIITFVIALWLFRIVPLGNKAALVSRNVVSTIRSNDADDIEREKAAQEASILLMGIFFSILYRSVLTLAASFLPIWFSDRLGWATIEAVTAFLFRVDVISISSIVLIIGYFAQKKLWHSK
jgi:hypothetical protein